MKSTTTFLRQQLKIKGKSQHNGRGVWEMTTSEDLTYDEIVAKINDKIEGWKNKGLVESFDQLNEGGERSIVIKFNEEVFNPFYNKYCITERMPNWCSMGVVGFTSPRDSTRALQQMGYEV